MHASSLARETRKGWREAAAADDDRPPGAVNNKGCNGISPAVSLVVDRVRGGVIRSVFDPSLPVQDHVVDPAC